MESLPEENENRGGKHDGSGPNRQPKQRLFAVCGIHQTQDCEHVTGDPDTGFEAHFTAPTVAFAFRQPSWMAAIHALTDVGIHFVALGFLTAPLRQPI
jgi:hypothetical protein